MRNLSFLNYKKFILKFSGCALSLPIAFAANSSMTTFEAEVASFLAPEMIAGEGESKNNSLTTGTRATLSLGTSTSFGSSANVSSTDAYQMKANSAFVPVSGSWKSGFGTGFGTSALTKLDSNLVNSETGEIIASEGDYVRLPENEGTIRASVGNIRSTGPGTLFKNTTFNDSLEASSIEVNDSEAVIADGATDEESSLESSQSLGSVNPSDPGYLVNATEANTAEGEATLDGITSSIELVLDPDQTFNTTEITYIDGNDDDNPMATANGSANLGLSNGLNVDLANTQFANAFSQAF